MDASSVVRSSVRIRVEDVEFVFLSEQVGVVSVPAYISLLVTTEFGACFLPASLRSYIAVWRSEGLS